MLHNLSLALYNERVIPSTELRWNRVKVMNSGWHAKCERQAREIVREGRRDEPQSTRQGTGGDGIVTPASEEVLFAGHGWFIGRCCLSGAASRRPEWHRRRHPIS